VVTLFVVCAGAVDMTFASLLFTFKTKTIYVLTSLKSYM